MVVNILRFVVNDEGMWYFYISIYFYFVTILSKYSWGLRH